MLKCINKGYRTSSSSYKEKLYRTYEKNFWDINNIIDKVLAAEVSNLTMTITRDTSSSDSESESDQNYIICFKIKKNMYIIE